VPEQSPWATLIVASAFWVRLPGAATADRVGGGVATAGQSHHWHSWVHSDRLGCFNGLVETGLANLKSAMIGTCHSCDPHHVDRYPAAYEWRFNRRFDLGLNLARLARVAAHTALTPYRSIAALRTKKREEAFG
jgi:hypothetical protein